MSVTVLILLSLVGLGAGFAGGLFGIGGGVVLVPALYAALGQTGLPDEVRFKVAIGTSLATIIVTSIRSVMGHHRHGHVEWQILRDWGLFIGFGAILGAGLARVLPAQMLVLIFGAGVLAIGAHKLITARSSAVEAPQTMPPPWVQQAMGIGTGVASSLLGIGGGVLGVLILTRLGRTVHRAVGTAAGFGLAIAVPGSIGYAIAGIGQTPLWPTIGYVSIPGFFAVAAGTFVAAPWGATLAARLSPTLLSRIFASYLIVTGVAMLAKGLAGS